MFSRAARASRRAFVRGMSSAARSNVARSLVAGGVVAGVAASAVIFKQFQELAEESNILAQPAVAHADDKVPHYGLAGTKHERTFIAIKPDGVHRALVGEVVKRFEAKGYKLVALKLVHPTADFAAKHYDDLKTKPFFGGLVKYFSSGPVVAMVWEGRNVIAGGRKLVGATRPDDATPGTVRGDFCIDVGRNVIHGSDSAESAKAEISLWFTEKEVISYEIEHSNKWVYEK